jgi:tetratricopeptide (TPR) repeat protein
MREIYNRFDLKAKVMTEVPLRRCFCVFLLVFCATSMAFAQIEEARQAIENKEFVRAVNILSEALANQPSADAYLYLGIAYGNMKDYSKAEDTLQEGARRYPGDARFHNELAGVYMATRDLDKAKTELHRALDVDPNNNYASDLLASIDISRGEVQSALRSWNKSGRPIIDDILHNYFLNFGSWVVKEAVAFHPAGVLRYRQWKTTEARLYATNNFTNVGLEVEPTRIPDHYDAIVRTTYKTNNLYNILWNAVKAGAYDTTYFNYWNIGNTGMNWNSVYRWDPNRHLVAGSLQAPLKLPGILNTQLGDSVVSEEWDLSNNLRENLLSRNHFVNYRANTILARVSHIPSYRFQVGAGIRYANQYSRGDLPEVASDSRNDGNLFVETLIRPADGRYENRLSLKAFLARRSILGDFNYSGGVAQFDNRITISKDTRTTFNWTIKGGTSRGLRPLPDYFLLGLELNPENILRGHMAYRDGRYGSSPMGSDFVLGNFDIDRLIATIPTFNYFNLPFITIKAMGFFDPAETWDRTHVFKDSGLLADVGGGLRFETPTSTLNLVLGRPLRGGPTVLYGYIQKRLW